MTETTRILVVGAGLVGRRHVTAIGQVAGAALAGIVDPGPEGAAYAAGIGAPHFVDLDAALVAGADGVILATPTPLHVGQGLACIAAGVPVLIEKPLAVTAEEAEPLVAAARAAAIPLATGHHRRHNPLIARAHELISGGAIGAVRAVQASCWFQKPDSYFAEAPWRTQPGAGPISVNLAHDIDLIRHLCGEVASVQAQAAPSARGHANEDVAAAVLRLANGALVTITVSDAIPAPWSWEMTSGEYPIYPRVPEACLRIGGTTGSLSVPDLTIWRHRDDGGWWTPLTTEVAPVAAADPLIVQIAQFVEVIRGRADPLVSGEEGLRTLRVIEAIQVAARDGGTVALTPA
ncbi:Gfo/Idh/MocA family oxidoreductase [uncultured Jannaschia sp.]|uniref:Gfo/Idh/MocA family protein n=1 Tax=uncultured Jannaschia sp. TaxID=293347 RepID=UPI00262EA77E|nr:Gfo/Idh/MocA family oxidoreductase [uncultured Jannaschia sp.]